MQTQEVLVGTVTRLHHSIAVLMVVVVTLTGRRVVLELLSRLTSQPHPLLIGVKTGNREGSPGVSCVAQVFLVVLCSVLLCFKLFCMLKKGEIYLLFFRVCVRAQ